MEKKHEDTFKELRKDNEVRDKTVEALAKQVGQLAAEMSKRDPGKLPSDTMLNPQHHTSSSKNTRSIHIGATSIVEDGEEDEDNEDIEFRAPLIPAQIGEVKTNKALLDYGASISILPGSVYDQSDLGPLQEVSTTVVLADYSRKRPRGILAGVAVKVGEFYYPEDFLVLDYEPMAKGHQPRVILGRPFLATANAHINCRDSTVSMTFGNRQLHLDTLSHLFTYSATNKLSRIVATDPCSSYVNEGGTKEEGYAIDRLKQVDVKDVKCEDADTKEMKPPWNKQVEYPEREGNAKARRPPKGGRQSFEGGGSVKMKEGIDADNEHGWSHRETQWFINNPASGDTIGNKHRFKPP
jgi:hypothetical protein